MVRTVKILLSQCLLALVCPGVMADPPFDKTLKLSTDCYPPAIFAGQTMVCSFVLSSEFPALEIEVAKFPEFRGFWIENLSLRQGPLTLAPVFGKTTFFRTTVGSYSLSPMVSRQNHRIEPMKLVVRLPGGTESVTLLSEPSPHTIRPLPTVGRTEKFQGAVGRFQFLSEGATISFQKDEPLVVRYLLVGDGNFQDVLAPVLPFPSQVEVLNKRAILEGTSPSLRKVFEYTVIVHGDSDFSLQPEPLLAFLPQTLKYEPLPLPPINFRFVPKPALDRQAERSAVLEEIAEESPSRYPFVARTAFYWGANFAFLLVFLVLLVIETRRKRRERLQSSQAFHLRLLYQIAQEAYRNGRTEDFLRIGEEVTIAWLKTMAPSVSRHHPRQQTLRQLKAVLEPSLFEQLRTYFYAHDLLLYSPEKQLPVALETLQKTLETVYRKTG